MSLTQWNPFWDIDRMRNEFNNLFLTNPLAFSAGLNTPRVDVYETENEFRIAAELPGVAKEDIAVTIDADAVRLAGEFKRSGELRDENVHRAERFYGRFSRVVPLPQEVRTAEAKADYQDGILTVTIPKTQTGQARTRRLDIN
ncbi:MAG: Hsp20/alpha crystallin family protein [bacterium]